MLTKIPKEFYDKRIEEYMALGLTYEEADFQAHLYMRRTWLSMKRDLSDEDFVRLWNGSKKKLAAAGIGVYDELVIREDGIHCLYKGDDELVIPKGQTSYLPFD